MVGRGVVASGQEWEEEGKRERRDVCGGVREREK
jgi:hypothetical protein